MMSSVQCWKDFLLSQHEYVIMGDFNLQIIDWTLERPTPTPGNKLMQLHADNNLPQQVHETIRQNHILVLVISTEEELIVNQKIIEKIGDHQAIQYSIRTENGNIASEKKHYNCRRANFDAMQTKHVHQPLNFVNTIPKASTHINERTIVRDNIGPFNIVDGIVITTDNDMAN